MKLYRFRYSPYARKVQMLLQLLHKPHEVVDVAYADRNELAELTGGYIYVPVLVDDAGKVIVDSKRICEQLLQSPSPLLPSPLEGPIWAYHDFCDGPLEDVMFRIGSPAVRRAWPTAGERALYTLVKERKFGAGCVDAWQREQPQLIERAKQLLGPSASTLAKQPFLFGNTPTLADAALYGNCIMLEEADPELLPRISGELITYIRRLEASARS
jgi:glutathione S-transferase